MKNHRTDQHNYTKAMDSSHDQDSMFTDNY
jgi:hypothetical protein